MNDRLNYDRATRYPFSFVPADRARNSKHIVTEVPQRILFDEIDTRPRLVLSENDAYGYPLNE